MRECKSYVVDRLSLGLLENVLDCMLPLPSCGGPGSVTASRMSIFLILESWLCVVGHIGAASE